MLFRRAGASCVLAACILVSGVGAIQAAADEPNGERCRQKCQEAKEERDAICRGLPTRKAREKCWRSSNEEYAWCVKKSKAGPR